MFHYNVSWWEDYNGEYRFQKMIQFNHISHPSNDRQEAAIQKAQELVRDGKEGVEVLKILRGIGGKGKKIWPIEQAKEI